MSVLAGRILQIAAALRSAGIEHAFGGALAYAYAVADPRGTNDIDVNVFLPASDARAAFERLPAEVTWTDADVERAHQDEQVRLFWDTTPVDIFFAVHDVHRAAMRHRHSVPLAGGQIDVLDATHLTVFKVMFNRTKDWADIEEMCAASTVDLESAILWLAEILGEDDDRIDRLRSICG